MWSHVWVKGLAICLCASKVIPSLVMSLLNVPSTPFPPIFSSPIASLTPPTASPTLLTGVRVKPLCCSALGWTATPNTGYEAKFCDVSASRRQSTFRPVNIPARVRRDDHRSHFTVFRSIKQASIRQQAEFLLCQLGSLGVRVCVKGGEIETKTFKQQVPGSPKILERKAELAVRGEKLSDYTKLRHMEVKHWEKRNSDIALYDSILESQRSATTGESMG